MKTPRRLAIIPVRYKSLCLTVDLYADVQSSTAAYKGLSLPEYASSSITGDYHVLGFFYATPNSKQSFGRIVLAGNMDLTEIIPHEVFHALCYLKREKRLDIDKPGVEEYLATAHGKLTAKIIQRIVEILK